MFSFLLQHVTHPLQLAIQNKFIFLLFFFLKKQNATFIKEILSFATADEYIFE